MPGFTSETDTPLPLPPEVSSLWTDDAKITPYDFYSMRQFIEWNGGLIQVPVAAPVITPPSGIPTAGAIDARPPCEIIQAVAPHGRRVVQWAAQRQGGPPLVPHPDPTDLNQVLLKAYFAMDPPFLSEDGVTKFVKTGATYIYALFKPFWLLDNLNMGRYPFDITPAASNVWSAAFFQYGLQNAGSGLG